MVDLFAGIGRLVGFMVGGWLAGWFVCYPVCRLVEPSGRLAISNLSPFDQPTIHPSIWSLTSRPKTVLLSVLASNQCLNFRNLGFVVSPCLLGWLAAVGLPDPCSQVAGQVWSVFHLYPLKGVYHPSLIAYPRIELGALKNGCVTCFAMICAYIFSCCVYSSQCSPYPLKLKWAEINFWWHHHRFSQYPPNQNPGKGLVWGFESRISLCDCSFYRFSTFEPSLGRDMLPPPRDLHPFGEGEFQETLCGNSNNASGIIDLSLCWELFLRMSCNSRMGTCMHRGNQWSPQQKVIVIFLFK